MCDYNEKETLSTLQFGQRAKRIKNSVKANVERSSKELERLLEIAEHKIKEYENLIRKIGGDPTSVNKLLQSVNSLLEKKDQKPDEDSVDHISEDSREDDGTPSQSAKVNKFSRMESKELASPISPKKMVTVGVQTEVDTSPGSRRSKEMSEHEELALLENMTSEEELEYLQKLEEETMRKIEEEEKRAQLIRQEEEKVQVDQEALLKAQADAKKSEALCIAQSLQIIDKNAENLRLKDEIEVLKEELRVKKQDLEDAKDKIYEGGENNRSIIQKAKDFSDQMRFTFEAAILDSQEKAARLLGLSRSLDEINLKLTYICNDSDLKQLAMKSGAQDTPGADGLTDLKNDIHEASRRIIQVRKEELNDKSLEPPKRLVEACSKLTEFIRSLEVIDIPILPTDVLMTDDQDSLNDTMQMNETIDLEMTPRTARTNKGIGLDGSPRDSLSNQQNSKNDDSKRAQMTEESYVDSPERGEGTEISKIIVTQRRKIEELHKKVAILENQTSSLKKKTEDMAHQYKKKAKDLRTLMQQKISEAKSKSDFAIMQAEEKVNASAKVVEDKVREVENNNSKLSEAKIELESLKRVLQGNDMARTVMNLETHMRNLVLERQEFFNVKFDLENRIAEKEDLIGEKDIQIEMLKKQMLILTSEAENLKFNMNPKNTLTGTPTPSNIVKKIRGGNLNPLQQFGISKQSEYNDTETTEALTFRLSNRGGFNPKDSLGNLFSGRSTNKPQPIYEPESPEPSFRRKTDSANQIQQGARQDIKKSSDQDMINKGIEDYKKSRKLSRGKKLGQPTQDPNRKSGEGLFGQFKNFLSSGNPQ